MGEVGDRHRFLPHVDPGVLLTLQLAQLVGDRLATRSGDLLSQPFAVRADAQGDRAVRWLPRWLPMKPKTTEPLVRAALAVP